MANDILQVLKYAISVDNPVISILFILIIAFLLFAVSRRFFTTDYIAENKESREQLKQLNEAQAAEIERLNKRICELELKRDVEKE